MPVTYPNSQWVGITVSNVFGEFNIQVHWLQVNDLYYVEVTYREKEMFHMDKMYCLMWINEKLIGLR